MHKHHGLFHLFCLKPLAQQWASDFINGFPGNIEHIAYAIKANSDPVIIKAIHEIGIRNFEIASLEEAGIVHDALRGHESSINLWSHNPLSSTDQIKFAYKNFGVRNFVVVSQDNFDRLMEATRACEIDPNEFHVSLRIKVNSGNHTAKGLGRNKLSILAKNAIDLTRES